MCRGPDFHSEDRRVTAIVPPPSRHARRPSAATYRRRRSVAIAAVLAFLLGATYVPLVMFASITPAGVTVDGPAPVVIDSAELNWPSYGAAALGVVELPDLLERRGTKTARPMASITKLITALTVLEAHPLDRGAEGPEISMTSADVAQYARFVALNGKVLPVSAGQSFSQRDLLEVVIIESSNNHAASLAAWAFGSESEFLLAAKDFLARNGLDSITVVDPAGIDDGNVGATGDLVALGKLVLQNPVLTEIVGMKTTDVDYLGEIGSTNTLLGIDGVTGLKTGTLMGWGANLLFSADIDVADQQAVTVVGVVLGAPDHVRLAKDVRRLLATARERIQAVTLASAGDEVGEYTTAWGETAALVVAEDISWLAWGDQELIPTIDADALTTGAAGTELGTLVFRSADGSASLDAPLELASGVDDPGFWWRMAHPGIIVGNP